MMKFITCFLSAVLLATSAHAACRTISDDEFNNLQANSDVRLESLIQQGGHMLKICGLKITPKAAPTQYAGLPKNCRVVSVDDSTLKGNMQFSSLRPGKHLGEAVLCKYSSLAEKTAADKAFDADPLAKYDIFQCYRTHENGIDLKVCPDTPDGGKLFLRAKGHITGVKDKRKYISRIMKDYGFRRLIYIPPAPHGRSTTLIEVCKTECDGE